MGFRRPSVRIAPPRPSPYAEIWPSGRPGGPFRLGRSPHTARGPARYSLGMHTQSPTVYLDLLAETAIPQRGILSQTLSKGDGVELVLFAFAAGEALTAH